MERIGPYEVLGVVGEGGMGRVYRARDERLGRDVAIKVLPEPFRDDPRRLSRFKREARAVARLSHPNILTVHDVGEVDGAPYLVTELLAGETLRERLEASPIELDEAIDIALQIARGLAVAHGEGVIHRDIKPSNLFVCTDGYVKILDFGIAKRAEVEGRTRTESVATREGTAIGSVGYMSPEQIRGREVDARTDLFALGIVLFEMITGERPFAGATDVEVAVTTLQDPHPTLDDPGLDALIGSCLAKSPDERYPSIAEATSELEAFAANLPARVGLTVTPARLLETRRRPPWLWGVATAVGLVAMAGIGAATYVATRSDGEVAAPEPVRSQPAKNIRENRTTQLPEPIWTHAVSADGKTIAYMAGMQTYIRPLAGGEPTTLPVPEGFAFGKVFGFFPDGQRVMALLIPKPPPATVSLAIVDLRDGSSDIVREVSPDIGRAGRLSRDGSILAFTAPDGIYTMSLRGGEPRLLFRGGAGDFLGAMSWSPDGKHLALIHGARVGERYSTRLLVITADGARNQHIPTGDLGSVDFFGVEWLEPGRIVYGQPGSDGADAELWEVSVRAGVWDGEPGRRVFRFPVGAVDHFRSGGGRLFVLKNIINPDIYRIELDTAGQRVGEPTAIEAFDADDNANDFTVGGDLLFDSDRNEQVSVFRRDPTGKVSVVSAGWGPVAAGEAVLYWGKDNRLYRAEPGAKPAPLARYPRIPWIDCAPAKPDRCVATIRAGSDLLVKRFDPRTGELGAIVHRRAKSEVRGRMRLDAEGARGALALSRARPTVAIVELATGKVTELILDGAHPRVDALLVDWMPGGGFAITAASPGAPWWVGLADASGKTRELWRTHHALPMSPVVAPDGRSIAVTVNLTDIDQWVIDGL